VSFLLCVDFQSFEFEVYTKYASNYLEATCKLEELLGDEDVVERFKSSKINLFKEAMKYILPNSLLEPVYHCFAYFEFMEVCVCVCIRKRERECVCFEDHGHDIVGVVS